MLNRSLSAWFAAFAMIPAVEAIEQPHTDQAQTLSVTGEISGDVLSTNLDRAWHIAGVTDAAAAVASRSPSSGICLTSNRYRDCLGPLFDSDGRWIQGVLVGEGQALVRATALLPNDYLDELLALEGAARLERRGRWARDWPGRVAALTFGVETVVEGEIQSVRPGRFTSYMTLADSEGGRMTIAVDRSAREALESSSGKLPSWKGRFLLVRGRVGTDEFDDGRRRPRIDVTQFRQIQLLE